MQLGPRGARQKHSRRVSFSLFFFFPPLFLSLPWLLHLLSFYYNQRSRRSRVSFPLFLSFFYSKRYVVFITQAYAQKSTRGTLGLLVPFEVGVRGGGYRTPHSLVRGTAGEHASSSRETAPGMNQSVIVVNRRRFSPLPLPSPAARLFIPCLAMCRRHHGLPMFFEQ